MILVSVPISSSENHLVTEGAFNCTGDFPTSFFNQSAENFQATRTGCCPSHLANALNRLIGTCDGTNHGQDFRKLTQDFEVRLDFVVGGVLKESSLGGADHEFSSRLRLGQRGLQIGRFSPVVRNVSESNPDPTKRLLSCESDSKALAPNAGPASSKSSTSIEISRPASGLSLADENQGVEAVDRRTTGNIEEVEGAGRFFD